MATFQVRIEDIIGAVPNLGSDGSTETLQATTDALTDVAAEIIAKVSPEYSNLSTLQSTDATSNPISSALETVRIIKVERKNGDDVHGAYVSCVFIDPTLLSKVQNPDGIYSPSSESPVWTFDDKKIYVFPTPAANYEARYVYVSFPSVAYGDSSVSGFPDELERTLVIGSAAKLKQRHISFYNEDEDAEVVALLRAQYQELLAEYNGALAPFMASGE